MTVDRSAPPLPVATVLGITAAAALVPLNSTMIVVALPSIADSFGMTTAQASVLITVYLVCMLVGQPIAGRVADRVGSRRTIGVALLGLAAFSGLAAVASAFWLLVVARVLQAVCATALSPSAQALLRSATRPTAQGRVFGIFGAVMGVGAAAGPVVGGVLVALFDWRAIFVVNVPIALASAAASRSVAEQPASTAAVVSTDQRIANPIFVSGYAAQALSAQAQYALLLLTPLVLDARGWGAGSIGLSLSALTGGMILFGPPGGRLGDRCGRRLPASAGLAIGAASVAGLALAGHSVGSVLLVLAIALFGIGLGAATPNVMSAALGSVPPDRTGAAAGVFTTARYAGSIPTTLLIAAWVSADAGGAGRILVISTVCMCAAVVATRWFPSGPPIDGAA